MNYGLDITQLRVDVIRPVLRYLDLHSVVAENLVLGTALVESRARYLKQIGAGPARGIWQMEPATERDIWERYLAYQPALYDLVSSLIGAPRVTGLPLYDMIGNLFYGAAMCRVHYRRVKAPLPMNVPFSLAGYWKTHYNTAKGAGTIEKALPHFEIACNG